MADRNASNSSPALIAAAWLLVLVPTGWGLTHTVQNALKLFAKSAPASASPSSASPTSASPAGSIPSAPVQH